MAIGDSHGPLVAPMRVVCPKCETTEGLLSCLDVLLTSKPLMALVLACGPIWGSMRVRCGR